MSDAHECVPGPSASVLHAHQLESAAAGGRDAWRRLDAQELARQYNARATVSDVDAQLQAYRDRSRPMLDLPQRQSLRYGEHPDEMLDLFPVPGNARAPLFVFVHGGYWRALGREDSVFMAENFARHGIAVAAINYSLAPMARLTDIVAQCRRSLTWLYQNAGAHGIDVQRIVVAGSSAGGHLAAMLAAPDWRAEAGVPDDLVKGAVLLSGLYDLLPLQKTTPNQWLRMDVEEARALSPIEALPATDVRLLVAAAALDTDEFKRQSQMYAAACGHKGCVVQYFEVPQRNHFDVVLDWMDPNSALTQATWGLFAH